MMHPFNPLPYSFEYKGKTYRLQPEWPCVLGALEALEDDSLTDYGQLKGAIECLIKGNAPTDPKLLEKAFNVLTPDKSAKTDKPCMDYFQDWDYIFSGFYQTYGIDLTQKKDMHWFVFVALLKGLPENTRLSDIIEIREMDVPSPDKCDPKRLQKIMEAKAKYALKGKSNGLQKGLASLFDSLKSQAKRR